MRNKISGKISLVLIAMLFLLAIPQASFAIDWGFNVGASGNGWSVGVGAGSGSGSGGFGVGNYGLPSGSIIGIISNLLSWLLMVLGIVGIIGFVIAGILYLLSFGDDTRMQTAKKAMQYSIIGVVVGLSGLVLMQAIFWALQGAPMF